MRIRERVENRSFKNRSSGHEKERETERERGLASGVWKEGEMLRGLLVLGLG